MDIQLKRGMLEVCVLRSLVSEDSYGYKIIKDVSQYIEISESTLYPILKRLETSSAVSTYSVEHNGRLRKYFSITNIGKSKLDDFINDWTLVTKVFDYIKGEMTNE